MTNRSDSRRLGSPNVVGGRSRAPGRLTCRRRRLPSWSPSSGLVNRPDEPIPASLLGWRGVDQVGGQHRYHVRGPGGAVSAGAGSPGDVEVQYHLAFRSKEPASQRAQGRDIHGVPVVGAMAIRLEVLDVLAGAGEG